MKVEIHRARKVSHWIIANDTLMIFLTDDLDEVTRQRFIAQAKAENGIEDRKRRGLIALLPLGWGHAAGHSKTAATAVAVGGGVLVVGAAAAVVLPLVLRDDSLPSTHPPHAAAPAPSRGAPLSDGRPPAKSPPGPPKPPRQPEASAEPSLVPRHPLRAVLGPAPVRHAVGGTLKPPHLPPSPVKPIPVRPGPRRHLIAVEVSLPPVGLRAVVDPRLSIQVRLGAPRPRRR